MLSIWKRLNFLSCSEGVNGDTEKVIGKGENAGHELFSISHNVFKSLLCRVVQSWDCVVKTFIFKAANKPNEHF